MQVYDAIKETYNAVIPTMNKITEKSFMTNIIKYALPILLYERLPYREYTQIPAYLLFTYLTIFSTLDTSLLNVIAAKKAFQIKSCDCPEKQIIRASLSSPFYYLGNNLFVNLLYFIPFIGFPLYWILYITVFGFSILEFSLSGMCTKHRYKYFQECMPYCFGIGLTIHSLATFICYLLVIHNPFFYFAILNILYVQIIMNAKFYPKSSIFIPNPFQLSRAATSHVISTSSNLIIEKLEKQEIQVPFILHIWNKIKFILGPDFKTLKSFLSRDVVKYLILEHDQKIKTALNTLIDVSRQTNVIWFVDMLGDILPNFLISEKTTIALKILKREGMTENLIYLRGIFHDIAYETTVKVFNGIDIRDDYLRAMSRSPSLEWSEENEFMVLRFPKNEVLQNLERQCQ
jgi:hypothetical protein